ncbi:hybrid sensor histidine kinase/response regulator [Cerasicoccus frondis]|uniref:hybrid sensor histidine kinase/response regulator n=1 Tax=Cerasicoccus frondis TaxID=490090 RepID=UPI002852B5A0|nr:ATP-binding protein [Cerasicoccus frondis]
MSAAHLSAGIIGSPPIRTFTPDDYLASGSNWSIKQDDSGRIYIANNEGLLRFDGVNWELWKLPFPIHDIYIESESKIWVCGNDEFGYFLAEENSDPEYISMVDQIEISSSELGETWSIFPADGRLYILSQEHLITVEGDRIKSRYLPDDDRLTGAIDGSTLYISQKDYGLHAIDGQHESIIIPIESTNSARVNGVFTAESGEQVFSTYRNGFVYIQDEALHSWPNELSELLNQTLCYKSLKLRDGRIACATHNYGLLLLSADGKFEGQISERNGALSDMVIDILEDADGNLWLTHEIGVSLVDLQSPYTKIDKSNGFEPNIVFSLSDWEDQFLVGTTTGCLALVKPTLQNLTTEWLTIGAEDSVVWTITPTSKGPLIADSTGYSLIQNNEIQPALAVNQDGIFSTVLNYQGAEYIAILQIRNAYLCRWQGRQLDVINTISTPGPLWTMVYFNDKLYAGSISQGLFTLSMEDFLSDSHAALQPLENPSLPENIQWGYFTELPAGMILLCNAGIYSLSQGSETWSKVNGSPDSLDDDPYAVNFDNASNQRLWLTYMLPGQGNVFQQLDWPSGEPSPRITTIPSQGLQELPEVHCLWVDEEESIVWFGGSNGLIRENFDLPPPAPVSRPPLLTNVDITGEPASHEREFEFPVELAKFEFALPYYGQESVTYRTRLVGQSNDWSAASVSNFKEFTNLREGDYEFQVQALVDNRPAGPITNYQFQILPPWSRTWSAYVLYLLIAILVAYLLVYFRTRRLQQANIALEEAVRSRTLELEKTNVRLAQANTAKNRFLANVSHEIRNPMNGIVGLAHLLIDDGSSADQKRLVHLLSTAEHLKVLLDGMLDFAAIENGQIKLQNCQFSISSLLDELESLHKRLAQDKGIDLYVIKEFADCPDLFGDEGKLRQILYNLTTNAVKFTHSGSVTVRAKVELLADENRAKLEFAIEDTGKGIPLEDQKNIFEQFNRGSHSNSQIKGIGLGLSIADRLSKILDGSLSLDTTYTSGARFVFSLSLATVESTSEKALPTTKAPIQILAGLQALVIEDEPYNQIVVEGLLKRESVKVTIAGSAEEALKVFVEHNWDFVLVDINLPGASGIEFAEMVRESAAKAQTPLIAMSAYVADFDLEKLRNAGISSFVPKPFTPDQLITAIQSRSDTLPTDKPKESPKERSLMAYIAGDDPVRLKQLEKELYDSLQSYGEQLQATIANQDVEKARLALHDMTPLVRLTQNDEMIQLVDAMHTALYEDRFEDYVESFEKFQSLPVWHTTSEEDDK